MIDKKIALEVYLKGQTTESISQMFRVNRSSVYRALLKLVRPWHAVQRALLLYLRQPHKLNAIDREYIEQVKALGKVANEINN